MVVKKRSFQIDRRTAAEFCLSCGALVSRSDRNVVAIYWGDEDPGRDELVVQWRTTHARMCFRCRELLKADTGLIFMVSDLEVELVLDTTNEKSKTRGDGVLPLRGTRRYV